MRWPGESLLRSVQHHAATALGVDEDHRIDTVVAMLANNAKLAPGYWIQLFLAMGIATLGLVLDSTAVVIGAMLVSPLMGPILELGMGFAVGSSLLTIRASVRVSLSIVVVVLCAAVLVLALPFHEVTGEIAARAVPTALDLLIAVFCALTAAYTTVRPGSDTNAAAAGTAIGIALVPPLCTVGFGIGTQAWGIAAGAALLFTANLSAILVLAVVSFLLLGFNQVQAGRVERDFLVFDDTALERSAARMHRGLSNLFGSRYGLAMRILIPVLFLAAVFVPLRRALDDVSWEVRTRAAVQRIIQDERPNAVQSALTVGNQALRLHLVIVDSPSAAESLQVKISSRIKRTTGASADVTVLAVPDGRTLSAAEERRRAISEPAVRGPVFRQLVGEAVRESWPVAAGRLLRWEMTTPSRDSATLQIYHLGPPLQAIADELLGRSLSATLQIPLRVIDIAVPEMIVSAGMSSQRWVDSVRTVLSLLTEGDSLIACVEGPVIERAALSARNRAILKSLQETDASRNGRMILAAGPAWGVRFVTQQCAEPASPAQPR